jgi:hypothetical protein
MAKTHQGGGAAFLNIVVGNGTIILPLLSGKDGAQPVTQHIILLSDLRHHIFDSSQKVNKDRHTLLIDHLDHNMHASDSLSAG